jgi:mannan endo-1,4-beta-mannosidase
LKFIGTNAYWLHALNTDQDISDTFRNISATGIKVVRTWAFNGTPPVENRALLSLIFRIDVSEVPSKGTWFQLIANGKTTINNGTNGLPRLDKVVELAEKHGIYLLLSLTNNWNPLPGIDKNSSSMPNAIRRDITPGTNSTFNRNFLSNDYGQ